MTTASPFVKWAGGKRQILPSIRRRLPSKMLTYYEPFVGGGSVFFALANRGAFEKAVINDLNPELVDAYKALAQGHVEGVIDLLKTYPYDRDFYNEMRARLPADLPSIEARAARFIYLNKAGFNGLYRVNKSGGFNVPFGKYTNPTICDSEGLREAAKALQGVTITCEDFEVSADKARIGSAVYFDPPYLPRSETANFTAYTEDGFGMAEHERLAKLFKKLSERGVAVLLSNADVKTTRKLYEGCRIARIEAKRSINSDGEKRGNVYEVLIGANL